MERRIRGFAEPQTASRRTAQSRGDWERQREELDRIRGDVDDFIFYFEQDEKGVSER